MESRLPFKIFSTLPMPYEACWHHVFKSLLQYFASPSQANFPAHDLNFHWRWRWWDQIQATFWNIFYFMGTVEISPIHLFLQIMNKIASKTVLFLKMFSLDTFLLDFFSFKFEYFYQPTLKLFWRACIQMGSMKVEQRVFTEKNEVKSSGFKKCGVASVHTMWLKVLESCSLYFYLHNLWRCSNDVKMIFWYLYWFQIFKDPVQCGSVLSIPVAVLVLGLFFVPANGWAKSTQQLKMQVLPFLLLYFSWC